MAEPNQFVLTSDDQFGLRADGSWLLFDTAGECGECCDTVNSICDAGNQLDRNPRFEDFSNPESTWWFTNNHSRPAGSFFQSEAQGYRMFLTSTNEAFTQKRLRFISARTEPTAYHISFRLGQFNESVFLCEMSRFSAGAGDLMLRAALSQRRGHELRIALFGNTIYALSTTEDGWRAQSGDTYHLWYYHDFSNPNIDVRRIRVDVPGHPPRIILGQNFPGGTGVMRWPPCHIQGNAIISQQNFSQVSFGEMDGVTLDFSPPPQVT